MAHKLLGIVGIFKDPYHLLRAAKEVQTRKFEHCDAFTPYPIHGLDKILGHKRSKVPWVTLAFGLMGCFGGLGLQIWVSAITWPLNIGGKPYLSIPAFIPITFECTVLLGGLATAAALLFFCKLPNYHTNLLDKEITNNAFALYIPAKENGFNENDVKSFMQKAGAYEIKMVE
ncbi:MAG: hypothetical protein A2W61_08170 [Deltaproteobacteria bacterium RIFCSPLOWO2_01_44_7]|nr:MAG: hypothetical protein A2712_09605 [Deltaproteobacteria bacterium RIFCSPHIGHO2_01_FULL_43_49]OGQ14927.1 MAG: hypothetical protein A3D22_00080 [Deltaproteobacteria bacterium RIFCSPHIGHO2_02_FULL_44_53]OGQ29569.1 MAG: hypothetical protein A3D98_10335 [Deltaproteobacteria bacterium RIFCSPHIGHO2_12_FULL_44_21]OGQ31039.1 MAG: hypothetical protein A2979_06370 [Deltaproteobacteria bacterium RIFCSPLOWO2_01_FULL_45_74]OGQ40030.1 MAG: hypothetical protein A2W61_08170 [Deltaproteobacteria bacterium 